MTSEDMFFDTDCISSFLWIRRGDIIVNLFTGKIILPKQVYDELKNPRIPHIGQKVDDMCANKEVDILDIDVDSEAYKIYYELTMDPKDGQVPIGKGEATAIALAKENGGIIASNNLRDIMYYVEKYNLRYITTGEILLKALNDGKITVDEGNRIWQKMILKRRKLPTATFTEYIQKVDKD